MVSASEEDEQHSNLWLLVQEKLHSALIISQASASRDPQLEADILFLKGMQGYVMCVYLIIKITGCAFTEK